MALKVQDFTVTKASQSGITYTHILRVTQNSVDTAANCSNITVEAILQSSKATTSFLFQYLEVLVQLGGETVIQADAYRDCVGTQEHIYEAWTGDLAHDENGELEFTVYSCIEGLQNAPAYMPPYLLIENQSFVCEPIILNSPPEIPAGLTAPPLAAAGGEVLIRWQPPADPDGNLTGYELQRSDDGGESFSTIYAGSNPQHYDEASMEAGVQMLYRVRAYDDKVAYSGWSEPVAVVVNSAPQVTIAPGLFMDQAGIAPAEVITAGRPLWLYPGRWVDPDGNLDGGCLQVEVRTKSRDDTVGDWSVMQMYSIGEQTIRLLTDEPDSTGYIQYRVACADGLGALSAYVELPWVQLNVAYSFFDGQWMKPVMGHPVMPYVRINDAWVRHGGEIPDPESSRLGFGKLGEMILGG